MKDVLFVAPMYNFGSVFSSVLPELIALCVILTRNFAANPT